MPPVAAESGTVEKARRLNAEDAGSVRWFFEDADTVCGLRSYLGQFFANGIRAGGTDEVDAASIRRRHLTILRLIGIRRALQAAGNEAVMVLAALYARDAYVLPGDRKELLQLGADAAVMTLTTALATWAFEHDPGASLAHALNTLHLRAGKCPTAASALAKVRRESDRLIAEACARYAAVAPSRKEESR